MASNQPPVIFEHCILLFYNKFKVTWESSKNVTSHSCLSLLRHRDIMQPGGKHSCGTLIWVQVPVPYHIALDTLNNFQKLKFSHLKMLIVLSILKDCYVISLCIIYLNIVFHKDWTLMQWEINLII